MFKELKHVYHPDGKQRDQLDKVSVKYSKRLTDKLKVIFDGVIKAGYILIAFSEEEFIENTKHYQHNKPSEKLSRDGCILHFASGKTTVIYQRENRGDGLCAGLTINSIIEKGAPNA